MPRCAVSEVGICLALVFYEEAPMFTQCKASVFLFFVSFLTPVFAQNAVGSKEAEVHHGSELVVGLSLAAFLIASLVVLFIVLPLVIGWLRKREVPPHASSPRV
jgi:hypothetical protein